MIGVETTAIAFRFDFDNKIKCKTKLPRIVLRHDGSKALSGSISWEGCLERAETSEKRWGFEVLAPR